MRRFSGGKQPDGSRMYASSVRSTVGNAPTPTRTPRRPQTYKRAACAYQPSTEALAHATSVSSSGSCDGHQAATSVWPARPSTSATSASLLKPGPGAYPTARRSMRWLRSTTTQTATSSRFVHRRGAVELWALFQLGPSPSHAQLTPASWLAGGHQKIHPAWNMEAAGGISGQAKLR